MLRFLKKIKKNAFNHSILLQLWYLLHRLTITEGVGPFIFKRTNFLRLLDWPCNNNIWHQNATLSTDMIQGTYLVIKSLMLTE